LRLTLFGVKMYASAVGGPQVYTTLSKLQVADWVETLILARKARLKQYLYGECFDIMLVVTPTIAIDEDELQLEFIRATGPGGQHVNKTATAVQLRFNAGSSPSLPDDVRQRLIRLAGNRMTGDGTLIITARRFRSQERNRQDAIDRLVKLIQEAAEKSKLRRKTKPTLTARQRRLDAKRQRSQTKRLRRQVSRYDD
jgi:ribosome-associated protein